MAQLLGEAIWLLLKNLKIELPYEPATPLLGIYQKKIKQSREECLHLYNKFTALFAAAKKWE